jgi:hypothetical protein
VSCSTFPELKTKRKKLLDVGLQGTRVAATSVATNYPKLHSSCQILQIHRDEDRRGVQHDTATVSVYLNTSPPPEYGAITGSPDNASPGGSGVKFKIIPRSVHVDCIAEFTVT